MFDSFGRAIDEKLGLQTLFIAWFWDLNKLEEWSLGQLVLKSHHLHFLRLAHLYQTTDANCSQLLEFAAKAITSSSCFQNLSIEQTSSSAAEGDKFMQVLADHNFN